MHHKIVGGYFTFFFHKNISILKVPEHDIQFRF